MTGPLTESIVTGLLRERHNRGGNGGSGEHAFLAQVRNGAGFDANRTFDAVSLNLWPSRGLALHVYEVKVSRFDWQRELAKPDKAEDACRVADHFWIVAPAGCVRDGELPDPWGLIEVTGDGGAKPWKLRTAKAAPKLHNQPTKTKQLDRGLVVAMLRSCPGAVPGGKMPSASDREIAAAETRGYKRGHVDGTLIGKQDAGFVRNTADDAHALVAAVREAGVDHYESSLSGLLRRAPLIAQAIANGQVDDRLDAARRGLRNALEAIGEGRDS